LSSIGDLFTNAKDIMAWLTKISRIVAEQNVPMSWITPLGLPVVQPYRKKYLHHVNSSQYMKLALDQDQSPIQVARQSSAFPPNFVHSLDSTHMLMTALECEDAALEFTAVHDSYWTHAATVDDMSMILRNKFVALHESPVLENLYKSVQMRFPQIKVPQVPKRGNLDLGLVRTSPYFFN
jgi:DNA-directed RNA polymerase